MKRYITVALKNANFVLTLINNMSNAIHNGHDAFQYIKAHLDKNQIPHNDQQATHPNELPHQGGFVSFYIDPEGGIWKKVEH